jgi:hypothetical protein
VELNVARVDIDDDSKDRYIVWHFKFDQSTSHFARIPIAAFSSSREAKKLYKVESRMLQKRKDSGLADSREYISSDQKTRGHNERARDMRVFIKKIKSQRPK